MKKVRILILVDCQYGFIEGGNLGVEGSKERMNKLAQYIMEHYKEYDYIILTADWHLPTHCSFKENGGIWPHHCVQFTHDGAIYQPIMDALNECNVDYVVLTKGCNEDHEEYSIFKNEKSLAHLIAINNSNDVEVVDYAGIALDYCVKDSILDGKKVFTKAKARLLKDFAASIGKPEDTYKILEDNNVEIVNVA